MALPAFDYWLFDLDGTLVDVEDGYIREVVGRVGDRLGCPFDDEEAQALWYGDVDGRARSLREHDVDPETFWRVFHEEEDPIARAESTYLHDDAAFVAELDDPVGLVTHCQQYLTEPVLDGLDIADWFDTVVCCDDDLGWKPDPAPVERAERDLGVGYNGHAGVLAGDGPDDVGAAWNADLAAIYVGRRPAADRDYCVRADYRLSSFAELV